MTSGSARRLRSTMICGIPISVLASFTKVSLTMNPVQAAAMNRMPRRFSLRAVGEGIRESGGAEEAL
jgi:hypothetical protein